VTNVPDAGWYRGAPHEGVPGLGRPPGDPGGAAVVLARFIGTQVWTARGNNNKKKKMAVNIVLCLSVQPPNLIDQGF